MADHLQATEGWARARPASLWVVDRLDFLRGEAVMTEADRANLAETPFLDYRWARDGGQRRVPLDELKARPGPARPPGFIWHTAFCCSTLIAGCLDAPGRCLPLREPQAVLDLQDARARRLRGADDASALALIGQMGVGVDAEERVLIKPSNDANGLALLAGRGSDRMLLLYSDCRSFLASVVGGGGTSDGPEVRRAFARGLFTKRLLAGELPGRRPEELLAYTDLQIAALFWHLQVAELRAVAQAYGPERTRVLDCRAFLADPAGVLGELDRFFDLGLGEAWIAQVAASPRLRRRAKQPGVAFDADARRKAMDTVEAAHGEALDMAVTWSYGVFPETPRGDPIGGHAH